MTDKFAICNMGLNGSFIKENGKIMEIERVVDLLNEQHEQIERLKDNFRALDEVKCELADENKQLKQFKEKVFTLIDKEIAQNEEAIEWLYERRQGRSD